MTGFQKKQTLTGLGNWQVGTSESPMKQEKESKILKGAKASYQYKEQEEQQGTGLAKQEISVS